MIAIKIPVPVYVGKYLAAKYGTKHTLSKTSFLGQLLLICLDKKIGKLKKPADSQHHYCIDVPKEYFDKNGHSIRDNTLKFLGICLEKLFKEELRHYLDVRTDKGEKALPELKRYLHLYGITEEDIKIESLYRDYQRYKNKKKKRAT